MNKITLDNYLPKPKIKSNIPKASETTKCSEGKNNPITEYIAHGKFKKDHPPKLISAANKIRDIYHSLNGNNYQEFPPIYTIIQYAENIDNPNIWLPFTAIDQKLYFFNATGVYEYGKNSIFNEIPGVEKSKLILLFDALYEFCTEIQKLNPWYNYIQYYNFFFVNKDSNSISDYNTLFKYLINSNIANNNRYHLSNDGYLVFRLNKKPVIALNNDILDYNQFFFYKYLKIKSKKYPQYLEKLIVALTKYIKTTLKAIELKEATETIFLHTYQVHLYFHARHLSLTIMMEKPV